MGEKSVTVHDIEMMQDILALTRPCREGGPGPVETAYEVLELLERLLRSDFVSFQDIEVRRGKGARRFYAQGTEAGEHEALGPAELARYDRENPADTLNEYWWQLPCSLADRTGVAQVTSVRSFFGEREWAAHPVHVDYLHVVDEILLAYPVGGGRSLRILTARESGHEYSLRELTLMELLLPHLRPLLEAVRADSLDTTGTGPRWAVTERQAQILHLVASGMPNKQVGRELGISEGTVRKHLENAYERLGVQSRTEAIFWLRDSTQKATAG